ncbi:MAG: hypothetical protein Q9174_002261 [Haloplaca sp. 1 TL-2023]
MANAVSDKNPIQSLESTMALVLKETGKFFRASQSNDPRQGAFAKAAIAQTIPVANQRFHEALDEIEIEILRARAVFERDLSLIRKKRAERERAATGAVRAPTPDGAANGIPSKLSPKQAVSTAIPSPNNKASALSKNTGDADDSKDVTMAEAMPPASDPKPPTENAPVTNDAIKTESFKMPQDLTEDPDQPKGLAITFDERPSGSAAAPTPGNLKPDSKEPAQQDTKQETPVSASLQDANFDSMFDDTNLPGTSDDINFDLAFSTDDGAVTTDLLNESAFDNIAMPAVGGDFNTNATTADEDITDLLPGLENYVNGGNDFTASIHDMSSSELQNNYNGIPPAAKSNDAAKNTGGDQVASSSEAPTTVAGNAPIESSFEDMFGIDSYMNGTGDDEMGGAGGVGDFDEDWFNGL